MKGRLRLTATTSREQGVEESVQQLLEILLEEEEVAIRVVQEMPKAPVDVGGALGRGRR